MINQEYKCFQFPENLLFDKHIGPAYKQDIEDDKKMNTNMTVVRVRVMKIKAVQQLDNDGTIYSEPQNYWVNFETGIIYDFDLKFPCGKIKLNEKINKDTYVIDKIIPLLM